MKTIKQILDEKSNLTLNVTKYAFLDPDANEIYRISKVYKSRRQLISFLPKDSNRFRENQIESKSPFLDLNSFLHLGVGGDWLVIPIEEFVSKCYGEIVNTEYPTLPEMFNKPQIKDLSENWEYLKYDETIYRQQSECSTLNPYFIPIVGNNNQDLGIEDIPIDSTYVLNAVEAQREAQKIIDKIIN